LTFDGATEPWASLTSFMSSNATGGVLTGPSSPIADLGCGFVGDPDFYNLRIRLGVYLQWLIAMLAHYLLTETISENLDVNAIFVFALFIALVSSTARNEVQDAEIVILLQLCWGFILGVLTIWGHRLREDHSNSDPQPVRFPPMGSPSRLTLTAAICAYSIWFWFSLEPSPSSTACPAYIFILAKADVCHGI